MFVANARRRRRPPCFGHGGAESQSLHLGVRRHAAVTKVLARARMGKTVLQCQLCFLTFHVC